MVGSPKNENSLCVSIFGHMPDAANKIFVFIKFLSQNRWFFFFTIETKYDDFIDSGFLQDTELFRKFENRNMPWLWLPNNTLK